MYSKYSLLFSPIKVFAIFFLISSCSPAVSTVVEERSEMEIRQLDTLRVNAPPIRPSSETQQVIEDLENRIYEGSYEKSISLVHTYLNLSFNWEERTIPGRAQLTMTPYFYDVDELRLDAKNFDIYSIELGEDGPSLEYEYDGLELNIILDKNYSRGDTFDIVIDYEAFPYRPRRDGVEPAPIQRGIYFINHNGEDRHKPMQIWTQGQTEYNSNWFPTIDKPNVRTTQETVITVEDRFYTLSNGLLVNSEDLEDGMRRDHYLLEKNHPPYLFMLAIGDNYVVVEDEWRGVPLEYIVEEEYEEDAAAIFGNTVEMLDFFSEKTGIEYPWPKYSQIVVRDFVAGAMENTTAVIYGQQVQRPRIDLVDRNNDAIVAHELIHHWFGNIVTTENWASLTLNEGFASFAEYLWAEYKYGADAAGAVRANKLQAYFNESANYVRPLLNFGYEDNEEMFDRHSYNKGGLVIQMLRHLVGEEAFFASWNKYLEDNMYSPVEVHHLRLAFEEVTGRDLNWFFDQWFYEKGHPQIAVSHEYDSVEATLKLTIEQTQDPLNWYPLFRFPVKVDVHLEDDWVLELDLFVDERTTELVLDCPAPPIWVNFDVDKYLLAEVEMERDLDAYMVQYQLGETFQDRHEAVLGIRNYGMNVPSKFLFRLLDDSSARIRNLALDSYGSIYARDRADRLVEMVNSDDNSLVRSNALRVLEMFGHPDLEELVVKLLEEGHSGSEISAALEVLFFRDSDRANKIAKNFENSRSSSVIMTLASMYSEYGSAEKIDFFKENYHRPRGFAITSYFTRFSELLNNLDPETSMSQHQWLYDRAMDKREGTFTRYGATSAINNIKEHFMEIQESGEESEFVAKSIEVIEMSLKDIYDNEHNTRVRSMIQNMIGQ